MKFLIIALFVAVATATPLDEDNNGPVELIVNGVPEGHAIDLSDVVDIKIKEHANGEIVSATNLLHPYTAEGIAESAESAAAAAAVPVLPEPVALPAPIAPEVIPIVPKPVTLPSPIAPEFVSVVPEPIVLPSPVKPEVVPIVPEPVILPSPVVPEVVPVVPEPVVLPPPVKPEVVPVIPEPVVLPSPLAPEVAEPVPAPLPSGEIFNDGTVSVTVNASQESGIFSTVQSWFSMVLNYFKDGVQTTQQIV